MDRLTKEQIELWRAWYYGNEHYGNSKNFNILCDLALQSLSLESVREEALEEALTRMDRAREILRGPSANWGMLDTSDLRRALQQSPARVAEGEPVREALSNLVSLLLQTIDPIGPMRDRKDYPPELQTAINVLRAAPESPAKEQPGEQNAQENECRPSSESSASSHEAGAATESTGYLSQRSVVQPVPPDGIDSLAPDVAAMVEATRSHVDGRDLLAELQPLHWHYCNIRVRINGQWKEYEGDWLKRLFKARGPLPPPPERP